MANEETSLDVAQLQPTFREVAAMVFSDPACHENILEIALHLKQFSGGESWACGEFIERAIKALQADSDAGVVVNDDCGECLNDDCAGRGEDEPRGDECKRWWDGGTPVDGNVPRLYLIETPDDGATGWGVSFVGCNPSDEEYVPMIDRASAEKLVKLVNVVLEDK